MTPRDSSFLTRSCADGPAIPRSVPSSAYERRPSVWRIARTRASFSLMTAFFGKWRSIGPGSLGAAVASPSFLRYSGHVSRRASSQAVDRLSKRRWHDMAIVAVLGPLAVFSIISIVLSGEEPSRPNEPLDNPLLWSMLGRRLAPTSLPHRRPGPARGVFDSRAVPYLGAVARSGFVPRTPASLQCSRRRPR